jgi:hypothetical protein
MRARTTRQGKFSLSFFKHFVRTIPNASFLHSTLSNTPNASPSQTPLSAFQLPHRPFTTTLRHDGGIYTLTPWLGKLREEVERAPGKQYGAWKEIMIASEFASFEN